MKCEACHIGCSSCSRESYLCDACDSGYFLSSNNDRCIPLNCHETCKSCIQNVETGCTECFPGFYMTESNKCEKCSQNCDSCSSSLPQDCTKCSVNYTFN